MSELAKYIRYVISTGIAKSTKTKYLKFNNRTSKFELTTDIKEALLFDNEDNCESHRYVPCLINEDNVLMLEVTITYSL